MARYAIKPNGEVVLTLSAVEARGLEICARTGYMHASARLSFRNKIQETAAQRALTMLHEATSKINPGGKGEHDPE